MRKGLFYISGILIFTLLLSSCVSKKKYEELARAKRSIDREVATLENDKKSLESEMQKLKDDFNAVRYQLTANNAAKDKQIDDLNTQLRALQNKESALKSELKDVSEQVKSKVQSSEGQLAELQLQQRTTEERDQIRKQLTDYKPMPTGTTQIEQRGGTHQIEPQIQRQRDCPFGKRNCRGKKTASRRQEPVNQENPRG
ncbi:MAG: hypothetical protein ACLSDJ_03315 [Butyricimonas faecihominis]